MLDPLNVHAKEFVMFPVNDNLSHNAGGSHWLVNVTIVPGKTLGQSQQ